MTSSFSFFSDCVSWNPDDVDTPGGLNDLIEKCVFITRRTFRKHVDHVDLAELEESLSYCAHPSQGLTMAGDWHVAYFRSVLHGQTVYGFIYSAIEFVFTSSSS